MYNDITLEAARALKNAVWIDARSPKEFKEATIPGAINIPTLLDDERMVVGTLYKQERITEAKQVGVTAIAKRLPQIFRELAALYEKHQLIVFCSRGGYRSGAISSFLYALGIKAHRLIGGYKSYRHWLLAELPCLIGTIKVVTLYGNTGAGKTVILTALKEKGYPVIDLEGLANHRGSLLGALGLTEQPSQKKFDSALYLALRPYQGQTVFFEGESRKIGRILLSTELYKAMENGVALWIDTPIEQRVALLVGEYGQVDVTSIQMALTELVRYIGKVRIVELQRLVAAGDYATVARELCERYYDINYKKPRNKALRSYRNDDAHKVAAVLGMEYDKGIFGDKDGSMTT